MVRIKKQLNLLIIFCVITSTILGFTLMFANQNYENGENINDIDLKGSDYINFEPLDPSDITINETAIFRHFQSVNISVNASYPDVHRVYLEINSATYINMTRIAGSNIFWYVYTPGYNISAGYQNVTFQVKNITDVLLNAHTTVKNFEVKDNIGNIFSKPEGYTLGDTLNASLRAIYESISIYDWNSWNVSIDDDMDDVNGELFDIDGVNPEQISFPINGSSFTQVNKIYYVRVCLNNDSDKRVTSFFPFRVLNNNPLIDESSIELTPSTIKRSNTDNCHISVNASDIETTNPAFLNVSLSVVYTGGYLYYPIPPLLENKGDGSFEGDFSIDLDMPYGEYKINLTVSDPDGGSSSSSTTELIVENNAPVIHDYKVNGLSLASGISINYGLDLVFTFNVSDLEGDPAYVKVVLIDSANNQYSTTQEYATDLEITIRTVDLITGIWYVYVYVIDEDGTMTGIDDDYVFAPVAITIIPDVLSAILPFLALVIGLLIGVAGGIGGAYYRMLSKKSDGQGITPKKTTAGQKKVARQAKSKKGPSKTAEETREKLSQTPDDYKKEESEPEKRTPQRKIKRKL